MADQVLNAQVTLLILLSVFTGFTSLLIYWSYQNFTRQGLQLQLATESAFIAKSTDLEIVTHYNREYPVNAWRGFQPFKVIEKKVETWIPYKGQQVSDICSFTLAPVNTPTPLPLFFPGQHLSFQLPLNDGLNVRYYSLSDAPHPEHYRVSIRRALPPRDSDPEVMAGLGSTYFHDQVKQGDIVLTGQPAGDFYLDDRKKKSGTVVLLAGGIGITPMVSTAKYLADIGYKDKVVLFYGIRHPDEIALDRDLIQVAKSSLNIEIFACCSGPLTEIPELFKHEHIHIISGFKNDGSPLINEAGRGCRIQVDLLKLYVEQPETADFYLCGPPPMMKTLVDGIYFWGIPKHRVHWEGFGPCAVAWPADILNSALKPCSITVVDKLKGDEKVHMEWSATKGAILDLADQNSGKVRKIPRQCGQGSCGTCRLIYKGNVVYEKKPSYSGLKSNECLTCCARPKGDVLIYLK